MFSEVRRYVHYRVRYLFDSLCEVMYSMIFITGIIVIFDREQPINLFYFYIYYSLTNVILLANEELEYEIRTNQYSNLKTTRYSLMRIYVARIMTYFIWSTLIFLLSTILSQLFVDSKFIIPSANVSSLMLTLIVHCLIFFVLYIIVIKLTEAFKRVSVFLNLMNTIILFYSGLVFPVSFFTYVNLLDFMLGI